LLEVLLASLKVLHISSKGYSKSIAIVAEKLLGLLLKGWDEVPNLRELKVD
jgi:hypothetical protein